MRPKAKNVELIGEGERKLPNAQRPVMKESELQPVAPPKDIKILTIDIESSPLEVYCWGIWEQNVGIEQIRNDWTILSYAAKWLGKKEIIYADAGGRGADKVRDDSILLGGLWDLLNAADLVIAQNGVKFDIRKINYRLVASGYTPYAPIRVIDTLTHSRRMFAATSHKLGWLSEKLTDTPKSKHRKFPGFELWLECLKDNPAAWEEMRKYNIQDIKATEKLYLRIRPWIKNHPNLSTYSETAGGTCPTCTSHKLKLDGQATFQSGAYPRYKCLSCGTYCRGTQNSLSADARRNILR